MTVSSVQWMGWDPLSLSWTGYTLGPEEWSSSLFKWKLWGGNEFITFPTAKFYLGTRSYVPFHWNITSPLLEHVRCPHLDIHQLTIGGIPSRLWERPFHRSREWGTSSFLLSDTRGAPGHSSPASVLVSALSPVSSMVFRVLVLEDHPFCTGIFSAAPALPFHCLSCDYLNSSSPTCLFTRLFIYRFETFHLLASLVFPTHLTALTSCAPSCLEYLEWIPITETPAILKYPTYPGFSAASLHLSWLLDQHFYQEWTGVMKWWSRTTASPSLPLSLSLAGDSCLITAANVWGPVRFFIVDCFVVAVVSFVRRNCWNLFWSVSKTLRDTLKCL